MKGKRKRRKKCVYIQYDYEAAYQKQLQDMDEENEKRMLQEGKVKNIYATKEIRSGEQLEVEIYPEFKKGQQAEIPDEGKIAKRKQAQKNLNDKNSRKMCERVINENFTDGDIWATFTYTEENVPSSMKEAQRDMTNLIKRINYWRKKLGLLNAKYVYVTECSDRGRWHHHIVMDGGLDMDTVEKLWKKGRRNQVRRLQRDEDGLVGMAKYITKSRAAGKKKQESGKYQKAWKSSKGLKKPKEKVNHYKTKQKDVNAIVSGKLKVEDHLKKWYPEYEYSESEVKYNKFNGKYYIYGRMRMKKGRKKDDAGENNKKI